MNSYIVLTEKKYAVGGAYSVTNAENAREGAGVGDNDYATIQNTGFGNGCLLWSFGLFDYSEMPQNAIVESARLSIRLATSVNGSRCSVAVEYAPTWNVLDANNDVRLVTATAWGTQDTLISINVPVDPSFFGTVDVTPKRTTHPLRLNITCSDAVYLYGVSFGAEYRDWSPRVCVDGIMKAGTPYVRNNGSWRLCPAASIRRSGAWRKAKT